MHCWKLPAKHKWNQAKQSKKYALIECILSLSWISFCAPCHALREISAGMQTTIHEGRVQIMIKQKRVMPLVYTSNDKYRNFIVPVLLVK